MRRTWTPDVDVDTLQALRDRVRRLREELQALQDTVASQQDAGASESGGAKANPRAEGAEEKEPER